MLTLTIRLREGGLDAASPYPREGRRVLRYGHPYIGRSAHPAPALQSTPAGSRVFRGGSRFSQFLYRLLCFAVSSSLRLTSGLVRSVFSRLLPSDAPSLFKSGARPVVGSGRAPIGIPPNGGGRWLFPGANIVQNSVPRNSLEQSLTLGVHEINHK